ncbi:hypothetical protein GCM10012275_51750 [Longimycelium tulufanense]|uniref:Tetratricopeptide repeat protein n=1 Tax=Longimycelium tulufanense TaxID=907463 RepID=A0A8J3CGE4_9PSEU|nr:tetratricopeptide repeat protein [Longimycelium tulufanense]GGM74720.1 hypothetical protein GCM10012275_51750 [Longimycelium tulufanense]
MTADSPFEAFRQAEALLADRQPLAALRALAPVLEVAPNARSVHLLAGRAYLLSAQLRRAEHSFNRVLEIDPSDHYARFALGRALERQGRLTEAHAQFRMAATMHPIPDYMEALGELRARIALTEEGPASGTNG